MKTLPFYEHISLKDIASIRTGFQFRGEAPYSQQGNYSMVHIRDTADVLSFEDQEIYRFEIAEVKKDDLLIRNDILLRSKGNNHFAVLVDRETDNTVVSGLSFIIRCKDSRIAPSYLAWYLNQAPAQAFLTKISAGTSFSVVNKGALGDLLIPLRPLPSQNAIGELYQLQLKKEYLTLKLIKSSRKLLNAQLLDAQLQNVQLLNTELLSNKTNISNEEAR